MEISIKNINCQEIVDIINRLDKGVDTFIELVNRNIPDEFKLSNKCFFIKRNNEHSFLNDGNTECPGYGYKVYWSYSFGETIQSKENIENLTQANSITFFLDCRERIYDHKKDRLHFFSLFFKGDNSDTKAERINHINDNHNILHLFRPYELMEVVYKMRKSLNLLPNNISENIEDFEKFAKNFESTKINSKPPKILSYETKNGFNKSTFEKLHTFFSPIHKFAFLVNAYWAISTKRVNLSDIQQASLGIYSPKLRNEFEKLTLTNSFGSVLPETFTWVKDSHRTTHENERLNSFSMSDCFKAIYGYSYFNEYISSRGLTDNWHNKLLYFSYYLSDDELESYYTISMTSCEGRCRKNYLRLIEATTLDELLSSQNAITVAKWLEEIFLKTYYTNYYISVISKENIENFSSTKEID